MPATLAPHGRVRRSGRKRSRFWEAFVWESLGICANSHPLDPLLVEVEWWNRGCPWLTWYQWWGKFVAIPCTSDGADLWLYHLAATGQILLTKIGKLNERLSKTKTQTSLFRLYVHSSQNGGKGKKVKKCHRRPLFLHTVMKSGK